MMSGINIEQLKEFLEFRIKNVENTLAAQESKIDALVKDSDNADKTQHEAIQGIASKVNLMWKILSIVGSAIIAGLLKSMGIY
jgi:uncharacterized coiled-coil protein SlyX